MKEKELLKQILDDYPQFFTKEPNSNHVKYHTIVTSEFLALKRQQYIVELAKNIQRPLRIWKEQTVPYEYIMNYEVNMEDIKQIILYEENPPIEFSKYEPPNYYDNEGNLIGTDIIIDDSGILELGINIYSNRKKFNIGGI